MYVSCHFYIFKPTKFTQTYFLQILHGFYWNFAILEVCDVSNFFSFFQFKSGAERLFQVFFLIKKILMLKVLVLVLECWKFLFLFFKVESSCSCSCRLKVPNLCFVKFLFAILYKNNLKKSFNFLKSWFIKCDL
jgi:hypothetical protein